MTALEKAKRRIKSLIAENGRPQEIALTVYRDEEQFHLHHPGEDFGDHLRQRAQLVAWLKAKQILVTDSPVQAEIPTAPAELARQAVPFRGGDPYRLGAYMGHTNPRDKSSLMTIGWSVIALANIRSGED